MLHCVEMVFFFISFLIFEARTVANVTGLGLATILTSNMSFPAEKL